jgi:hypothetical protein
MASFVHICPKGTSCPRNDIEHCTHFDHPYRRTKVCHHIRFPAFFHRQSRESSCLWFSSVS